ncbi:MULTISPECIES: hypothetical protein [unclassified Sulfitobacter]|jgi:hypothetical protein|uniref:hypothetical protein n=1 Tax=unclassified Sulfitobacter TaxID=196795 RepID=UPI0012377A4D|nr:MULTISPECIES: hypothetical protein [unclassified Sulfitobacter]
MMMIFFMGIPLPQAAAPDYMQEQTECNSSIVATLSAGLGDFARIFQTMLETSSSNGKAGGNNRAKARY